MTPVEQLFSGLSSNIGYVATDLKTVCIWGVGAYLVLLALKVVITEIVGVKIRKKEEEKAEQYQSDMYNPLISRFNRDVAAKRYYALVRKRAKDDD